MRVHRIVTGVNAAGKSDFVAAGAPPKTHDFVHIPGMTVAQLWCTAPTPVIPTGFADPTEHQVSIVPKVGGTQLLLVSLPPDTVMQSPTFNPEAAGQENSAHAPGLAELFEPDNPGMHTTDTVDYGILLEGELTLELDDGKFLHLKQHDVVVQNGTRHAWRNGSNRPALMAFVLIGAHRHV